LLVGIIGCISALFGDRLGSVTASVVACGGGAVPPRIFFTRYRCDRIMLLAASCSRAERTRVVIGSLLPRIGMALGLINGVAFGAGSVLVTLVGWPNALGPSRRSSM